MSHARRPTGLAETARPLRCCCLLRVAVCVVAAFIEYSDERHEGWRVPCKAGDGSR